MSADTQLPAPASIVSHLHIVLKDLSAHPFPHVPNPPNCPKRASVALIIRIQPRPSYWPENEGANSANATVNDGAAPSTTDRLDEFFSRSWVKNGDPEILFIKRAARKGDPWTSHVALPGGKRDPGDESDEGAAARETWEEVGLDLSWKNSIFVGNLPERVITRGWGTIPLMVLCPFVYVLTRHDTSRLKLQPSEVGSCHWVSFRALLSPSLRTQELANVADRLAPNKVPFSKILLQALLGQMTFAAIRLLPSESLYSTLSPGFIPNEGKAIQASSLRKLSCFFWSTDHANSSNKDRPLLLWGLTLGVLSDLLDLLPPHNALGMWTYPSFASRDVQLVLWAMTYRFRRNWSLELERLHKERPPVTDAYQDAASATASMLDDRGQPSNEVGIAGMGIGIRHSKTCKPPITRSGAQLRMLQGYWPYVRPAVMVAMLLRLVGATGLGWLLWVFWFKKKGNDR